MTVRVYVPRDAAALALGADAVASLLAQAGDVEVVRTGSRGLFWLEPMVEVATSEGRIAYGPVTVADISGLLAADMLAGGPHPLRLGPPEKIPYLAKQTRLTFARCGVVDPLSLDDYRAHGGLKGLRARSRDRTRRNDRAGHAVRPARSRWRRLSDRHQVEDRCRRAGRAQVHRLQRGRRRLRHVRRSDADGRRSVRADRGHGDRRLRSRCDEGLRIYALGVSARDRHVQRGTGCRAPGRPARRALRHRAACRRRRLRVRRRDLVARQPGGQARPGARQAAAARAQGIVRRADRDQQRHFAGQRADHHGSRRGLLSRDRHGPFARHDADPACRQHQVWRPVRMRLRHHAGRAGERHRRRHAVPAGRCAPFRSAGRSVPISHPPCSTPRSTTRRSPRATD